MPDSKFRKIDLFLQDIIRVCKKHKMTIGFEGMWNNNFIIRDYEQGDINQLLEQSINETKNSNKKVSSVQMKHNKPKHPLRDNGQNREG